MSSEPSPLDAYRGKRDFTRTPEPAPAPGAPAAGGPRFAVQRHDARALHFDLRLEVDGALASWAVPKGPPLREGVRRLAVRTEDHPLEYLSFAAVIPEGQYGAGRMSVWDSGTYEVQERTEDEWKVVLEGRLLRGHYHLVRTRGGRGKDEWLIFRSPKGPPGAPDPTPPFRRLRPMLATRVDRPFDDPAWAAELKWDGYRALALITGDGTELRSRTGRDMSEDYPALRDLRRAVMAQEAVLDGEVCVLDDQGRARFNDLQAGRGPVTYVVFDLLYDDGEWLCERPWNERRERLAGVIAPEAGPRVMISDHVEGAGLALFAAAGTRGVEGVVLKRMNAPYRPGRRTDAWRKVKVHEEVEAVVGGFTRGDGARRGTFGALLVGIREPAGLRFAGQVGSGFSDADLRATADRLSTMVTDECPFTEVPATTAPATWVRPELEVRVRFAEETPDRRLRAPVAAGLPRAPAGAEAPTPPPVLDPGAADVVVAVGDRQVRLTNLAKPFWPGLGLTKRDLLDHYARMAEVLIPHVGGRAMTLKRYPDGAEGEFFFQHELPQSAPEWLPRTRLPKREGAEQLVTYAEVDDVAALLWVVNLGCVDLNPQHARAATPGQPTWSLLDLDPSAGVPFARVAEVALMARAELAALGLEGWPKTSGSRGMHVLVPLPPGADHDLARGLAGAVAARLLARRPDLVTTRRRVADRGPRVYVDVDQNGRGKTIASVYSPRPVPAASVSTPLHWDEVGPGLDPRGFTIAEVAARVAREGDLFAGVLTDAAPLDAVRAAVAAEG